LTTWAESVRHYIPAHLQGQRRRCNLEEEHLAPQFLESHSKDPVQTSRKKAYQACPDINAELIHIPTWWCDQKQIQPQEERTETHL
jgi:hypothetical protein